MDLVLAFVVFEEWMTRCCFEAEALVWENEALASYLVMVELTLVELDLYFDEQEGSKGLDADLDLALTVIS